MSGKYLEYSLCSNGMEEATFYYKRLGNIFRNIYSISYRLDRTDFYVDCPGGIDLETGYVLGGDVYVSGDGFAEPIEITRLPKSVRKAISKAIAKLRLNYPEGVFKNSPVLKMYNKPDPSPWIMGYSC